MKIILKADVEALGKVGDVLVVADGYARNYLLPKGLAVKATPGNLKQLEASIIAREEQKKDELEAAKAIGAKINDVTVVVRAKAGDKGKLFGSVTNTEIAAKLLEQHDIEVDKRKVDIKEPIKATGFYTIYVKLHPEVVAELKVAVEPEEDPKKQAAAEAPEVVEEVKEEAAEPEEIVLTEETEALIEEAEATVIEE
jgi:large subunit ribosomal protein L9